MAGRKRKNSRTSRTSHSRSRSPGNRKKARTEAPSTPPQSQQPPAKSPSDNSLFGSSPPSDSPKAPQQAQNPGHALELPSAVVQVPGQSPEHSENYGEEQQLEDVYAEVTATVYMTNAIEKRYTLERVERDVRRYELPARVIQELREQGCFDAPGEVNDVTPQGQLLDLPPSPAPPGEVSLAEFGVNDLTPQAQPLDLAPSPTLVGEPSWADFRVDDVMPQEQPLNSLPAPAPAIETSFPEFNLLAQADDTLLNQTLTGDNFGLEQLLNFNNAHDNDQGNPVQYSDVQTPPEFTGDETGGGVSYLQPMAEPELPYVPVQQIPGLELPQPTVQQPNLPEDDADNEEDDDGADDEEDEEDEEEDDGLNYVYIRPPVRGQDGLLVPGSKVINVRVYPERFNYYRPYTVLMADREPNLLHNRDGTLAIVDYEFSDQDDVPDMHLADMPDERDLVVGDQLYLWPTLIDHWVSEDYLEANRQQYQLGHRTDLKDAQLVEIGLAMNRLFRIYRKGCLKGRTPSGWTRDGIQGCRAADEWPTKEGQQKKRQAIQTKKSNATRKRNKKNQRREAGEDVSSDSSEEEDPYTLYAQEMHPDKGMMATREPLELRGLKALCARRFRVRDALSKIPVLLKVNPANSTDNSVINNHFVLQEKVADAMTKHESFKDGFEVPSGRDLQTITLLCQFANDRWKTPTPEPEISWQGPAGRTMWVV